MKPLMTNNLTPRTPTRVFTRQWLPSLAVLLLFASFAETPLHAQTVTAPLAQRTITLADGSKMSYDALEALGELGSEPVNKILNSLPDATRRTQKREYADWVNAQIDAETEAIKQRIAEKNVESEATEQRIAEMDVEIIKMNQLLKERAEQYVSWAEQGKLIHDPKFVRENILANPLFDDALKKRAMKILDK
jgi:hypothetical protein